MFPVAGTHSVRLWRYGKDVICSWANLGKQSPHSKEFPDTELDQTLPQVAVKEL
jgi:hypothetical protein